jgi:S-adenosylmethionine synthetase
VPKPLSINIDTYGTGRVDDHLIEDVIKSGGIFDFRPRALIQDLGLLNPEGWSYRDSAAYGHFGRTGFPWEKTDKVEPLLKALGR